MELIKKDDYQVLVINSETHGRVEVLVDLDIDPHILQMKWFIITQLGNKLRVLGRNYKINRKTTYLHREVVKAKSGQIVDHINGNPLDNRRANLRICTTMQNCQNAKMKNNTTGYKGVFNAHGNKFCAKIGVANKMIHLGSFSSKEEAAIAYNKAALKYHGKFARLNKIN